MSQRTQALELANRARVAQAQFKRQIKSREIGLDEAILAADFNMPVSTVLAAGHRMGDTRAEKLLAGTFIRPDRPVRTLTKREREELAGLIRQRYRSAVRP
jgi:hypothetical protein